MPVRSLDSAGTVYDPDAGLWTFHDAYVYTPAETAGGGVEIRHYESQQNEVLLLEPQLPQPLEQPS